MNTDTKPADLDAPEPETPETISLLNGKVVTLDELLTYSIHRLNALLDPVLRAKLVSGRLGIPRTAASKAASSATQKGRKLLPDHTDKLRERHAERRGKPLSDAHRATMSASIKASLATPNGKAKSITAAHKAWETRRANAAKKAAEVTPPNLEKQA